MFIPDGQVSISARIDRKGYCQGEDININAKFENTCSRIVVPKAAIVAKQLYVAEGRTKVGPPPAPPCTALAGWLTAGLTA